jgi:uncharacterized membrane protein
MAGPDNFLTPADEQEVVEAIRLAEKETSGEIRVHIEKTASVDAFSRATEVFSLLKMDETKRKNGVLFYLAINDKSFVILGDKGIDAVVEDTFWNTTKDVMAGHFKNGDFKRGLIEGITLAGHRLQEHFPCEDDDTDELSNEISKN